MRHDPASAAVVVMLRGLKMYGMAQAVADLIEQGAPAFDAAIPILSQLLKAELAEREVRSIAYQIKAARFPAYKDLAGFDFASSEVNEAMVRQLQGHLLKRPGGDREMVEILSLVLHHDEQAVLCAVELALEAGVPTKTHVLNILHRLTDGKAPPASPIDAPQALRLAQEPLADVGRYDNLRGLRHAS